MRLAGLMFSLYLFQLIVIFVCEVVGGVVCRHDDGDAGLPRKVHQVLLVLSAGQRYSSGLSFVLDIKKVGVAVGAFIDVSWFRGYSLDESLNLLRYILMKVDFAVDMII